MSDNVGVAYVEVRPDARGWSRKLREEIGNQTVTVNVDADTGEAAAQIDEVARDRRSTIQVEVDKSFLSRAQGALSGLAAHVSGLGLLAGGLGPALIPLGAGALGLGAALGGPLAAAAGGLGAFAAAAALAVKHTQDAVKAGQALTPVQKQFVAAQTALSTALGHLTDNKSVFKPLVDGMGLLARLLPAVSPLLTSVSGAVDSLINGLSKFSTTGTFKSLTSFFSHEAGVAIRLAGEGFGNVALGIARIFRALTPQGNQLLEGFVNATRNFGKGDGLNGFIGVLKTDLPLFTSLVGNLFKLVARTIEDLAPYGTAVLTVLDKITGGLAKLHGIAGPLAGGLLSGFLLGPEAGVTVAAVLGLVEGFHKLYDSSKPLQRIFHDLGDYFTKTWLPAIKNAARQIGPALSGAFHDISKTIRENKPFLETVGKALVALGSSAVIGGIRGLALAIRGIGKAFEFWVPYEKVVVNILLGTLRIAARGFELFARVVLSELGVIVNGAAKAFGWLPGIGGHVKAAAASFNAFSRNVVGNLNQVGDRLAALQRQINGVGNSHPSFKVIAQTTDAIRSLEALQAYRIRDKSFTVYQRSQAIDRAVGPGGGQGSTPHAGGPQGGPGGTGNNNSKFTLQLDDQGRHTLTGFVQAHADSVYHANRQFEHDSAGR